MIPSKPLMFYDSKYYFKAINMCEVSHFRFIHLKCKDLLKYILKKSTLKKTNNFSTLRLKAQEFKKYLLSFYNIRISIDIIFFLENDL